MGIKTGGPAFPRPYSQHNDRNEFVEHFGEQDGMTLRDYFAAKAMQALMPELVAEWDRANRIDGRSAATQTERGCEAAYRIADAMLKARNA